MIDMIDTLNAIQDESVKQAFITPQNTKACKTIIIAPSYLSDPSSRLSRGIELIPLFQSDLFVAEENEPTDVFEQKKDRLPSLHAAVLVALALLLLLLLGLHIGVGLAVPTVAPVLLAARQHVADVDQLGLVRLPLCRRYLLVYPSAVHR
eukprot:CAMPEP_0194106844 /NCGR_PEP_ID=MMETSP0150-20130528/6822_1 /TAXON_ID=122233 /ORGANISM="Chaetoceros debilis, Strain MM31A-1" /LENGTH=149 /DNA_ID=CAMNT_0038795099 /DNA_START=67 /DNA_END=517 /DNA_ORIENTATION=+